MRPFGPLSTGTPRPSGPAASSSRGGSSRLPDSGWARAYTPLLRRRGPGFPFGKHLIGHAESGRRHRLQPVVCDCLPTRLADAVGAVVKAAKSVLDIGKLGIDV